jgi:MoxR-like ATPase
MPVTDAFESNQPLQLLKNLPPLDWEEMTRPEDYVAWDNELIAAANVALTLGKPLLLTGEPGVGKSEFARWLAHELELGDREKFVVKSTTEATDLFYTYDTLGRFHDAQIHSTPQFSSSSTKTAPDVGTVVDKRQLQYLNYQALGIAILNSRGRATVLKTQCVSPEKSLAIAETPRRTVVLIDEIDKAPRDVPTDILDEIDKMAFSVKEIGSVSLKSDKTLRPIVVITSNSERDLPEPFLRRCIYYHIPFPKTDKDLQKILLSRLRKRMAESSPLLSDTQALFSYLRNGTIPFQRKPGLAELLDWLYDLTRDSENLHKRLSELDRQAYMSAKSTLLKHAEDQKLTTEQAWRDWLQKAGLVDG